MPVPHDNDEGAQVPAATRSTHGLPLQDLYSFLSPKLHSTIGTSGRIEWNLPAIGGRVNDWGLTARAAVVAFDGERDVHYRADHARECREANPKVRSWLWTNALAGIEDREARDKDDK